MVNFKPSRGCGTCKNRRIKCDESRPACQRCTKSGLECPGFPDPLTLVFRDQTDSVTEKAKSKQKTPSKSRQLDSSKELSHSYSSQVVDISTRNQSRSLIRSTSKHPRHVISTNPRIAIDTHAVGFLFRNFVIESSQTAGRPYLSTRPVIDSLVPLYVNAQASSPIRIAIHALALKILSHLKGQKQFTIPATERYGRALSEIAKAIQDPVRSKSDETLMCVMLLGLYEMVPGSNVSVKGYYNHMNGALALVQHRGREQFANPQSLSLFRTVRAAMVSRAIAIGEPLAKFTDEDDWLSDDEIDNNLMNMLYIISVDLPALIVKANTLLERGNHQTTRQDVLLLLSEARMLDERLRRWHDCIPTFLLPTSQANFGAIPKDIKTAKVWPGLVHVYHNVWQAAILNDYRKYRLYTQVVIVRAINWLSRSQDATEKFDGIPKCYYIIQEMVDGICASVPFFLGYDLAPGEINNPASALKAVSRHFLLVPLFVVVSLECIPEEQRAWVHGRMKYLHELHGITPITESLGGRPAAITLT